MTDATSTAAAPFLCIDRVPPLRYASLATGKAVEVRADNGVVDVEGTADITRYWANGMILRVRFLEGSAALIRRVMAAAAVWTTHANLDFELVAAGDAEIRVTFRGDGNWSAMGTDALVPDLYPADDPTMCLSEVPAAESSNRVLRVVRHEFGHAIGLLHEHQNPGSPIRWNADAVYAELAKPPNNWSRADVDVNVLMKYGGATIESTPFDPESVMLYTLPSTWTLDGRSYPMNHELSKDDIALTRTVYPGRT